MIGLVSWISIASIPIGGWLTDRTGMINLFIVTASALCALSVWMLPAGGTVLVWVIVFGVAIGGWPGAIMALPGQALSPAGRSTGLGVFYTVYYMGMAVFPPIAGWLQGSTQTATASVIFGGFLMAATIAALAIFRLLQRRLTPLAPQAA
jgi:MFS family permease